jgi:hypothetical protein
VGPGAPEIELELGELGELGMAATPLPTARASRAIVGKVAILVNSSCEANKRTRLPWVIALGPCLDI